MRPLSGMWQAVEVRFSPHKRQSAIGAIVYLCRVATYSAIALDFSSDVSSVYL
jgi:hypothetical protein